MRKASKPAALVLENSVKVRNKQKQLHTWFAVLDNPDWPNGSICLTTARSDTASSYNQALQTWEDASKSAEKRDATEKVKRCCS